MIEGSGENERDREKRQEKAEEEMVSISGSRNRLGCHRKDQRRCKHSKKHRAACAQRDCIDLRERRRRSSHLEERATEDPSRVAEADVDAGNGSDAQTRVGRDPPEVHIDRTHGPFAAVVERERQLGNVATGLHKHACEHIDRFVRKGLRVRSRKCSIPLLVPNDSRRELETKTCRHRREER